MSVIYSTILIEVSVISAWSGSTVDLEWIHVPPCWWTMFVGNSVFKIQEDSPENRWLLVKSMDNPAGYASQSTQPSELYHHSLGWVRPEWLIRYRVEFSQEPLGKEEQRAAGKEERTVVILHSAIASSWLVDRYL